MSDFQVIETITYTVACDACCESVGEMDYESAALRDAQEQGYQVINGYTVCAHSACKEWAEAQEAK